MRLAGKSVVQHQSLIEYPFSLTVPSSTKVDMTLSPLAGLNSETPPLLALQGFSDNATLF
jgi:hypothetical protein